MTDRVHSLTVVLDQDIRDDDVQGLVDAIRHLRHVLTVEKNVSDLVSKMAESRARADLTTRIYDALERR